MPPIKGLGYLLVRDGRIGVKNLKKVFTKVKLNFTDSFSFFAAFKTSSIDPRLFPSSILLNVLDAQRVSLSGVGFLVFLLGFGLNLQAYHPFSVTYELSEYFCNNLFFFFYF
jgi:hypothetical protein